MRGAYFDNYGEKGHELIYLRNPVNLPTFALEFVDDHLENLSSVSELKSRDDLKQKLNNPLVWNLTANYYFPRETRKQGSAELAGFGFHRDIEANGEITMIITLESSATMEFIKADEDSKNEVHFSVDLIPGSIAILTGDSRWNFLHRVVPKQFPQRDNLIQSRTSIVFGCS